MVVSTFDVRASLFPSLLQQLIGIDIGGDGHVFGKRQFVERFTTAMMINIFRSDIFEGDNCAVQVANKPGELEAVRTDSGIVFAPNRPIAISVMTAYDRRLPGPAR